MKNPDTRCTAKTGLTGVETWVTRNQKFARWLGLVNNSSWSGRTSTSFFVNYMPIKLLHTIQIVLLFNLVIDKEQIWTFSVGFAKYVIQTKDRGKKVEIWVIFQLKSGSSEFHCVFSVLHGFLSLRKPPSNSKKSTNNR